MKRVAKPLVELHAKVNRFHARHFVKHNRDFWWFLLPFGIVNLAIYVFDGWLVNHAHVSISQWFWSQVALHPTIGIGGTIASLALAWVCKRWWGLVWYAAYCAGHLFSGVNP